MNQKGRSQEEIVKQAEKLLEERGRKALEMAKKEMLQEKIECKEVRKALDYFMTEYWKDLARPALLSLCCEAVGGDPETTIPMAIPLSLISGGIDIHDDIIDQSEIKHSRPTVLGKFGKDIALLAGDALIFKGLTMLHEASAKGVPDEKISVISDIIKTMFFDLGDAEAMELKLRGRIDVTPEEYLRLIKKKAADVEAHTRISAVLGDGTREEIESLGGYGRLFGILILLRDELLDTKDYEEITHRIEKECLPLPLLYALESSPQTRSKLVAISGKTSITRKDVENLLREIDEVGGYKKVNQLMKETGSNSISKLKNIKFNINELRALVQFLLL